MIFSQLSEKPDQSSYYWEQEDPAIRADMEGGYAVSRPRFLRKPRKTFYFNYKTLPDEDYQKLEDHWAEMQGGSKSFPFVEWHSGVTYEVRFKERFSTKFVGGGADTRWWDVTNIVLEEV